MGCAGAEGNHNGWVHSVIVHCTCNHNHNGWVQQGIVTIETGGLCLCVSHRCHWLRAGGTEDMKGLEILKEETFIIEL